MANLEIAHKRFLVVSSHPDDSILAAGKIARETLKGNRVDEAILSHTSDIRIGEQREAMNILGMSDLYLPGDENGWEDGTLAEQTKGLLTASVVGIMNRAADEGQPYTDILGMFKSVTGHPDHSAVSDAIDEAFVQDPNVNRYWGVAFTRREHSIFVNQYGPKGYFVPVPEPPHPVPGKFRKIRLTDEEFMLKRKAAWAHNSQRFDIERHDERFQMLAETGGVVELYRYKEKAGPIAKQQ